MRKWLLAFTLGSVYLIAYSSVLSAGFVYEDRYFIDPQFRESLSLTVRSLSTASFAIQDGASPSAHHVANLLLHASVAVLVWAWLYLTGFSISASWVGATLILWHPMAVEATAYIAGRPDLIAGFLVMLACCLANLGAVSRAACVGAVMVALLSGTGKDVGLIACLFVPLILMSRRQWWRAAGCTIVLAGAGAALWGEHVLATLRWSIAGNGMGARVIQQVDPVEWIRWQSTAAVRMIGLLPVPIGQNVVFDVELVPVGMQWLSVAWLLLLASVSVWLVQRHGKVAGGIAWMLAVIVPRLIIRTPLSVFNEHQFYLALPGAALIVAAAWEYCAPRGDSIWTCDLISRWRSYRAWAV